MHFKNRSEALREDMRVHGGFRPLYHSLCEARVASTTPCSHRVYSVHFLQSIVDNPPVSTGWIRKFNATNILSNYYVPGPIIINFNKSMLSFGSSANKSKPYNSEAGSIIHIWVKKEPEP